MTEVFVKHYTELTADELYDLLALRAEVFVVEQNCAYLDPDGVDKVSWHVWLRDERGLAGCLRVYGRNGVRIGRVVVRYRREGLGTRLMAEGIRAAREKLAAREILISAQQYAQPFYERSGFVRCTDPYLEDGIPHVGMRWRDNGPSE